MEALMKRRFYLGSLLAIPAVAVMLATLPGCPSKEGKKAEGPPKNSSADGQKGKGEGEKGGGGKVALVVAKADGTIKGRVIYDGTPPEMPDIKGIESSGDKVACLAGPHKVQTWMVSKDHGVANVVVSLEAPAGKYFAMTTPEAEKYQSKKDAVIDQPHCIFEPHVVAAFAAFRDDKDKLHQTGAKLLVKNSGTISHNTKSSGNGKINGFNITPKSGETNPIELKYQREIMPIACDKHTWMGAVLVMFDHPFFAVTDKDGNFEIKNVPTGEFTLKAWHEDAAPVTEKIDAKAGENKVSDLRIKAKTAS
jgi:hypothetical protein